MDGTSLRLSDEEIALLAGKCRPEIQAEVDKALLRLDMRAKCITTVVDPAVAAFIGRALEQISKEPKLIWRHENLRHCCICDTSAGYCVYPRSGRYHRKGEKNYDRPRYLQAIELVHSFVHIRGSVNLGCCNDCMIKKIVPALREALEKSGIVGDFPEAITGKPNTLALVDKMKCKKCGWEGSPLEMGWKMALMSGCYPAECPKCSASDTFAYHNMEVTGKVLVDRERWEYLCKHGDFLEKIEARQKLAKPVLGIPFPVVGIGKNPEVDDDSW